MSESTESPQINLNESYEQTDGQYYPPPDLTYLTEMADGDEAFITEIITYFVEFTPGLLCSMKENALEGDFKSLKFSAHKLLPQLVFVGILTAIPDIEKIEMECELKLDLFVELERAIRIINYGIKDLKKMI